LRLRPLRLLSLLLRGATTGGSACGGSAWLLRGLPCGGRRFRLGLLFDGLARRWLIFLRLGRIRIGRVRSGCRPGRRVAARLPWRRADALGVGDGVSILQRGWLIALDQLGRNALRYAWHALGEHRLAIAWQLFLAVEKVAGEPIRRINRISDAG